MLTFKPPDFGLFQSLKRKERDYEHEMERLAREKIACQQRLSALKKELSAQWDHIDFATLLPEAPPTPIPASSSATMTIHASTVVSTAPASSRGGGRSFDSDEDFEFEELEDEMRRTGQVSPQHSASTSTASGMLLVLYDIMWSNFAFCRTWSP